MTGRFALCLLAVPLLAGGCPRKAAPPAMPTAPSGAASEQPAAKATEPGGFRLTSEAFGNDQAIPAKYTADGEDVSPDLSWGGVLPDNTQALAIIMDDPDAPAGTFTHWLLYDMPTFRTGLAVGVPAKERLPDGEAKQGKNSFGTIGYKGPAPPRGKPHHYHFTIYALDAPTGLAPGATRKELVRAMEGHAVGQAELVGTYQR
jgi:Raf kinase inhibitor-like YbhB/YbcL family protein